MYVIEALKSQDRRSFACGDGSLDRYIRERATQDIRRKLNRVFIIRAEGDHRVLGYYTLASATIEADRLPPAHTRHLPRYPIPAALLGKLAVDQTAQGRGIGKLLLANAIRRVQSVQQDIGIHVLVVDPIDDNVTRFYAGLGFMQFPPQKRLFLFLNSVE